MSGHYTTLELVDYERGYLTGDEARDLFAHCQQCEECGGRLAAVLALRHANRRRVARIRRRKMLSLAAGVVLVVSLGFAGTALWGRFATADGPGTASVAAPGGEPTIQGAPELSPELAELAALATDELPNPVFLRIRLGPLAADSDDWEVRVRAALMDLWEGRLDVAVPALENLHSVRQKDPEVAAYLGIALYLSGDRREDVADLLRSGASTHWDNLRDQTLWYLANHHLRNGDPALAAEILAEFSRYEHVTARAAHALMDKLPAEYRSARR